MGLRVVSARDERVEAGTDAAVRCELAARWLRTGRATLSVALCLRMFHVPGACVAPPRSQMKGRNITSICNSLRQIDINGDGFNKV